ncbi:MAG: amino acid permease, partial [Verrucomicrobiota bacterium]
AKSNRKVGIIPAIAVTVGSMVGVGVFTSLGYQVVSFESGAVIAALWILGGLYALCGALCYAEVTTAFPRSGGEYQLLSRLYHPAVGFMSGWVSVTVGFAVPTALAAMAFDRYFGGAWGGGGGGGGYSFPAAGLSVLLFGTAIHLVSLRWSGRFQAVLTTGKVLLIAGLIVFLAAFSKGEGGSFFPGLNAPGEFAWGAFAISFLYVTYAYSGWNSAAYIAGEIRDPNRSLPVIFITSTLFVTGLYLTVNLAMFSSTPLSEMAGRNEVAFVAANHVFGGSAGRLIAGLISFGLLSAVGAMMWAGPRVAKTIGEDLPQLRWFAKTNRGGIPVRATALQFVIAAVFILTNRFESAVVYIELAFLVTLGLTVAGVFVLRFRFPEVERPYSTFGYPWTPVLFLLVTVIVGYQTLLVRKVEFFLGIITLSSGLLVFYAITRGWKIRRSH